MQVGYAKIVILDEYLAIGSMTGEMRTTIAMAHRAVYRTNRHASLILFITASMDDLRREENKSCTQR